jgi:hypothetical protein
MAASSDFIRLLALEGAQARVSKAQADIDALKAVMPELEAAGHGTLVVGLPPRNTASELAAPRRHTMSASAKKAVSKRMKKYWAQQRKEKAKA